MFKEFESKEFEQFVIKENSKNSNEIFAIDFQGHKYWVKKARKTSSNIFHKSCYKLMSYELLKPVLTKSPPEAILFETNKLISFKSNGLNVPDVIGSNENFFVLSDCGRNVYGYLKLIGTSKKEFYYYVDKYILELCKIHNANMFHGGAQSRNFTYLNGKIYAIDLEDSFDDTVDLKTLQFRDLLLLLLSMSKVNNFENYKYIIELYINNTKNKDFIVKLKELSLKLKFLIQLNKTSWIHQLFPKDVKGFCKLLEELQKL